MIDFDVILEYVGGFGRYQIMLAIMICYFSIPFGMITLAPIFTNYKPDYRCNVPPIDNKALYPNLTEDDVLNLTTPYDRASETYDTCYRYNYNLSACIDGKLGCVNTSADTIKCDMGYYYDRSLFPETATTEFDMVCDQSILDPLATSIYMVGVLIGSALFGLLADLWGRRTIMIGCCVLSFAALIGCSFVHDYWLFVVCRFMVAFFGFGCYLPSFVYLMEITSAKWRTVIGLSFQISFAIGYMILSGVAYQWRNWHELNLVTAIFGLPYAVCLIFIPESPRWLFSNEKDEKAKSITRKFAKFNKVKLDEPEIWNKAEIRDSQKNEESHEAEERSYSVKDLFRTKGIRILTFKVMFNWFANSFVYYGISLNAGTLAGDIFVNNILSGVVEAAAYLIVLFFMDLTGRRYMLIFMMGLSSLALLSSTIVFQFAYNQSLVTLGKVFAFAAKLGISGSYAVIYNFTSELYPTVVRSNGIGIASMNARIGSILAPFVIALQSYIPWLPNVIMGVVALIATGLSFMFPETKDIRMLESIEEAELFYAGKKSNNKTEYTLDTIKSTSSDEYHENRAYRSIENF